MIGKLAKLVLRIPILVYRYAISPLVPGACRHVPTCSDYVDEAIRINGAWKGGWLGLSRLLRCHPFGSQGLDPVPDLRGEKHPFYAPWRYGRWSGRHIRERFPEARTGSGDKEREGKSGST